MKSTLLISMSAVSLLAALATPVRLAAQEQQQQKGEHLQHYVGTYLGTLGGTFSELDVNNKGLVSGTATLTDGTHHASLWQKGLMTDIGIPGLGGPNSGAFGVNERGQGLGSS